MLSEDNRQIRKKEKRSIPQANDVDKIFQFPAMVFDGYDSSERMVEALGFVRRQSSYYRHAAEYFGLITSSKNRFTVTRLGEKYLTLSDEEKRAFKYNVLLGIPFVVEVLQRLEGNYSKAFSRLELVAMIRKQSRLTGTTLGRRAQTILSWFRWIESNAGSVEVDRLGNIRLARQTRLIQ